MARMRRAWAIYPSGKNLVRNLQYGPRIRLLRGMYRSNVIARSEKIQKTPGN